MLAAYTRFSNIITSISAVDLVGEREVYLWNDLVLVASFLATCSRRLTATRDSHFCVKCRTQLYPWASIPHTANLE